MDNDRPIDILEIIRKTANENALAIENRLAKLLSDSILDKVKNAVKTKEDYLKDELDSAQLLFNTLQNSLIGAWLIRRAIKKLVNKQDILNDKNIKNIKNIKNTNPKIVAIKSKRKRIFFIVIIFITILFLLIKYWSLVL